MNARSRLRFEILAGCALIAAVLWGLIGPVSRVALDEGVEPLEIAFWRALLGGACYALHSLWMRETRVERRDVPAVVGFGIVGVALFYGAYLIAVQTGGAALASVLLYTAPAWVAVFSALFLHERLPAIGWVGVFLSVLGSVMIAFSDAASGTPESLVGDALALLGAITGAGYFLLGRVLRPKLSLVAYISLTYGVAAITLVVLALVLRVPLLGYSPTVYGLLLLLAIVPQLIGHTILNRSLGYLPAVTVAIAILGEPVGATILAAVFLGEDPSALEVAGGLLLLAGVYLGVRASVDRPEEVPVDTDL